MTSPIILCFGESLWDCLPQGLFLGGAPLNVAYHIGRVGGTPIPVTAVGTDFLGAEVVRRVKSWGICSELVSRVDSKQTGIVQVDVSNPTDPKYTIVEDVAWDYIGWTPALERAASEAHAIVFDTLAGRAAPNRDVLAATLDRSAGMKVLDVNLRFPFVDVEYTWELAARANMVKLNDGELKYLSPLSPSSNHEERAAAFAEKSGCARLCVTCGGDGAGFWDNGEWYWEDARPVVVRDTIGAGDSFLAALLVGLIGKELPVAEALKNACRLAEFVASKDGATPEYDVKAIGIG